MKVHTGEKPHTCEAYAKEFKQVSHLIEHMKSHTGEKPHGCMTCGKDFQQVGHSSKRVKIHSEKSCKTSKFSDVVEPCLSDSNFLSVLKIFIIYREILIFLST